MKALISIVLLLAFGVVVWGNTPTPEQIAELKEAAAKAQFELGVAYDFGRGVPEDDKEAVKLFRKAAEQGHVIG